MPSETIYQPDHPFDVRVAWGKEQGEVQVATLCTGSPNGAERITTYVNQWLENASLPQVDYQALAQRIENPPYFDGFHASLRDRRAVNDLIRTLRRARDQAFGRDE